MIIKIPSLGGIASLKTQMKTALKTCHVSPILFLKPEQYRTAEGILFQTVRFLDGLLDFLEEHPGFQSVLSDGQEFIWGDYFEIRPEQKDQYRKLIEDGRIIVGLFFGLCKTFPSSGEALIRNLLLGSRVWKALVGKAKEVFITDAFVRISQLPQILRGFGIDTLARFQTDSEQTERKVYRSTWAGPDGSQIGLISIPGVEVDCTSPDTIESEEGFDEIEALAKPGLTSFIIRFNVGSDPRALSCLPEMLQNIEKKFTDRCVLCPVENMIDEAKKNKIIRSNFNFTENPFKKYLEAGDIERDLKEDEARVLMERYAEPLNALSVWDGHSSQSVFLRRAWQQFLKCYALYGHISSQELKTGFDGCIDLAKSVCDTGFESLYSSARSAESANTLIIFNPSSHTRNALAEVRLSKDTDDAFRILDRNGKSVPFQVLRGEAIDADCEAGQKQGRVILLLDTKKLPPLGFRTYRIERTETPPIFKDKIRVGRFFMENRWLRVEVGKKGLVSVLDKERDVAYEGLNMFEDGGEVGEEDSFIPPENDRLFLSKSFEPRISVVEQGPLRGSIRIRVRMKAPEGATSDRKGRSSRRGMIKIWSTVRLTYNSRRVEFETIIESDVKDHCLRVLFPTDCRTRESYAQTPFHVTRHAHRGGDSFYSEHTMSSFVTVADERRGLSLLTQGLHAYTLRLDNRRTLALPLNRNVSHLYRTGISKCSEKQTFRYALFFNDANVVEDFSLLYQEEEDFRLNALAYPITGESLFLKDRWWLKIEPDRLQITAFKKAEDGEGFILRLFNPSESKVEGSVVFSKKIDEVWECRLDEEKIGKMSVQRRSVIVHLRPWQVFTMRVVPFQ